MIVPLVLAAVEATWGLRTVDAIVQDPRNVVLPLLECRLDGFTNDWAPHRTTSVLRSAPNGRILARVLAAGTFYPAVVLYDSPGLERLAIAVKGVERGVAVADHDDNRERLFFLTEPVTFQGGEELEFRALTTTGPYRTENLLLLREKPAPGRHEYRISDVAARAEVVTFRTNWPVAAAIEYDGGKVTEPLPVANHRVSLPGRATRYRITTDKAAVPWQAIPGEPPAPTGATRRATLPLTVESFSSDFPVTAGVPFPKGALGSDAHVRLLDAAGGELPLQTRTLARWDDGSVKWVLLDFQSRSARTVEYGTDVRRRGFPSSLQITETGDAITVSDGPVRFTASRRRFSPFDSDFHLTGPDGTVYTTLGPPEELAVEERGPLRAVLRATGHHRAPDGRKLFTYAVRLHAFAGRPYVRMQYTFGNDFSGSDFIDLRSLTFRLPLPASPGARPLRIEQHTDGASGARAEGWAEWTDGKRAVTLALRDFWQNYPKDLTVSADGLELALLPPLRPDEYAAAKGTVDEHRLYYYLQNGWYKLRQGVSKTHDLWLDFGPSPSVIRSRRAPLLAWPSPEWFASTRVFGDIALPRPSGVLAQYDAAFTRSFDAYLRNRETNREYGLLNFGDWWGERVINWGNSEYDTQHAFLLQFARTGDLGYFRAAEEMEWHNRDVDTVHHHADPEKIGGVYLHCVGHTGDYFPQSPVKGQGIPEGRMSVDHTFIEGHLDYSFLTGDPRSYETARAIADRYDTYYTRNYDFRNCRQPGWHLILTMAMYNATYDPFYLNAARIIFDRLLERQTSDGGWRRQLTVDHCQCVPRHHGNTGFMVGVLLTGLKQYYLATGDDRAADSIVKGARFLVNDMWVPEVKGFRYTSCPRTRPGAGLTFLLFDGIAFAHQRTGDPRLRQVLIEGTGPALAAMGGWGKGFTQFTRVTPYFIQHLSELVPQGP